MTFELLGANLTPAEHEETVRTYHCTTLTSGLLRLRAEGYLTITNKRAVFYAFGNSFSGKSILQSEVPIADISGINCYKGTYFSLKRLFVVLALSFIIVNIVITISGLTVFTSFISLLSRNPSVMSRESNLPSFFWILVFLTLFTLVGSFFISSKKIWRSVLAFVGTTFLLGLAIFGGNNGLVYILVFIAAIYSFICSFWYAQRETLSLAIGSKGGLYTPIAISGISSFGIYNTAALRALSAEPALDAETMIKELGAMIHDIQTLGDFGIRKWQVIPRATAVSALQKPVAGA